MVLLPEEAAMTLAELRQMAARQQHQIEAQQQLLVAKEQRLKFLKQQEARHHNLAEQHQLDPSCLQNLRDKVESQEMKLRQLRALRGQVEQQKTNNGNLGAELDSIRALFSEKEKELNLAVNKVEELSRQLDEIRNNNNRKNCVMSSAVSELENLRRELMYRTKLSEQQSNYICQQRETITNRQQDISLLDKKINELTQRLHRKRLLNEQLASQIHSASLSRNLSGSAVSNGLYHASTIVAVEPIPRDADPEHTRDDMSAKLSGTHQNDLGGFYLTKKDPKYQTLPYNTKFTLKGKCEESQSSNEDDSSPNSLDYSPNSKKTPPLSVVKPSSLCNPMPQINNCKPPDTYSSSDEVSNRNIKNSNLSEIPKTESVKESELNENSDSKNNNVCSSQSSLPIKEKSQSTNSRPVKPVVPPKPALPVKPMISIRPKINAFNGKSSSEKDVNVALSVLQNKSSDKDKTAISNYRERLLYYQCIPRFSSATDKLEQPPPKSKIATYFPKPSAQSDASPQAENRNESADSNDPPKRKPNFGQLPIKPKPLTIRKTPGLEPPKLKVQSVTSTSSYRKSGTDSQHLVSQLQSSIPPSHSSTEAKSESEVVSSEPKASAESIPIGEVAPMQKISEESNKNSDVKLLQESRIADLSKKTETDETDFLQPETVIIKDELSEVTDSEVGEEVYQSAVLRRIRKGNLKGENSVRNCRRVSFDPLALLLDAALEGELELVKKTAAEVPNPSAANDEGITALHNAICAGHIDVVTFLVEFGCDVNAQDSDGWTPLHCAASCNNLPMVKFLVERGACIFATTLSDHETAAEKCEEDEEGFDGCSEYLYSLQENLGVMNNSVVYAVYDYEVQNADELSFRDGDMLTVLRKGDDEESEWWWSRFLDEEGYVPRNLLGLYPRVTCKKDQELAKAAE
ncbi:apoptosis-stimulating of p53 protein 2 isoform X1 [Parasteatoda tepidariorum]|uniref:apoptosis-stimulating of p53 protein 2 isoform X1 n=2 Tax=Parasteatoda tepidariorum TaxID=114398 RepID=UPI001C729011|nr:apoptosis-stimulating of p53 protein 2 isoform X1 [Parasteatoda tepidariorum]